MKFLQTILALIALVALMLPCTHAEEHHHHELAGVELCAVDHAECHTCSDEPCTDTPPVAPMVSISEIPVRTLQLLAVLKTDRPAFVAVDPSLGELLFLQTVQLLI